MALFLWLLMALVPWCLGKGALRILYGNQPTGGYSLADEVLTGWIISIGLAEAAHLAACMLGRSFSDCIKVFGIELGICLLVAVVIILLAWQRDKKNAVTRRRRKQKKVERALAAGPDGGQKLIFVLFGLVVLLQFVTVVTGQSVYVDGDMTVETVNSFLATDAVYQVNPMTGEEYTLGMPLRLKILCLPTLYGILCRVFQLDAVQVVWEIVPAFVLIGGYLAYGTVAKKLFPEDGKKRGSFLLAVSLLYTVGDYLASMDGFGVLHSGFRGTSIRGAILLPYVFGLLLRRKYKLVVLCILAEVCIVWTLYGMGACLLVTVGMVCVYVGRKLYGKRKAGEEDVTCTNS